MEALEQVVAAVQYALRHPAENGKKARDGPARAPRVSTLGALADFTMPVTLAYRRTLTMVASDSRPVDGTACSVMDSIR